VNEKEKIVLVIMVILISAMCIYPPYIAVFSTSWGEDLIQHRYGLIWDPPVYKNLDKSGYDNSIKLRCHSHIDFKLLLTRQIIPTIVIFILFFMGAGLILR